MTFQEGVSFLFLDETYALMSLLENVESHHHLKVGR